MMKRTGEGTQQTETPVSDLGDLEEDTTTLCATGEYGQNLPRKTSNGVKLLDREKAKYLTRQD